MTIVENHACSRSVSRNYSLLKHIERLSQFKDWDSAKCELNGYNTQCSICAQIHL